MRFFLKVLWAEARKQRQVYFHNPIIYFSMFLWPFLEFLSAYYMYKPFQSPSVDNILLVRAIGQTSVGGFLLIGHLCYLSFFSLVQSAWRFASERYYGTLECIFLTPANRFAIVVGNATSVLVQSLWLFTIFTWVLSFFMIGQWGQINVWSLLFGLAILFIASVAWGALLNSLFLLTRDAGFFFTIMQEPMMFFSGVKFPLNLFPIWMQYISYIFPLTYCLFILREIVLAHSQHNNVMRMSVALLGVIGLMFVTSFLLLKWGERLSKQNGSLSLY